MSTDSNHLVIVGAGIAGLTLADRLSGTRDSVTVVDRAPVVGGLSRSFAYDDGFTFDIGPHRFGTDLPRAAAFIKDVLGKDQLTVPRKNGVWLFDRYFDWPLRLASIVRMPPMVLASVGLDLLRRKRDAGESFESYVLSRYGRTLYELFFAPYTQKFLGKPGHEISPEWAIVGVERAVIDQRFRADSLARLARTVLRPPPPLEFVYPASGGIGVFCDRIHSRLIERGVDVRLGSRVSAIERDEHSITRVVINDKPQACDRLIWTGNVTDLAQLLDLGPTSLEYLSLVLFNYRVAHPPLTNHQWCYFAAPEIPFSRVSLPSLFNPTLAWPGQSGVCVEVTAPAGSIADRDPARLEPAIRASLVKTGVIRSQADVRALDIEMIPGAYPLYTLDYPMRLSHLQRKLEKLSNLHLVGRNATFWHNNMDHSIDAALELAERLG